MRITIEQSRLLKSLQVVERAVNDRSALPILANILLETKPGEVVFTATDLDVGIKYRLPLAQEAEAGAIALPARRFSTIVRELPDEQITLEAKKNCAISLACRATHFRLQGLPPEDFPTFPIFEQTNQITIPQATLKTMIVQTAFAMSVEETRFVLNGTLLKIQDGAITLVATDGRRLAVSSATLNATKTEEARFVIPAKTIRELGRLLQEGEGEEVAIAPLTDNQLLFQFGEVTILTRLIDGQFPQYESVLPAPSPTALTCDRTQLTSAIRRASLMTTAASQAVVFEIAKDRLAVSKESPELGSAREELEARYTGEPMTVAFNPEFWLDALKILDGQDVTIELSSPEKPAVVRLPQFLYVVLPMKLA